MSGWDKTRRITLDEPWQAFYVDLFEDPPMGDWLALNEAATKAIADKTPENIDAAVRAFTPLVAGHNITTRSGEPLNELSFGTLSLGLFVALLGAIRRAMNGPDTPKKGRSRGRSSRTPSETKE